MRSGANIVQGIKIVAAIALMVALCGGVQEGYAAPSLRMGR